MALDPTFTSRVYRARQLICGQYASWAAEMNMVYLPLGGFFQCSDSALTKLEAGLSSIALHSKRESPQSPVHLLGVSTSPGVTGHIFLDLEDAGGSLPLKRLHGAVAQLLEETSGVTPNPAAGTEDYRSRLPLMTYAQLPPDVYDDAVEFARDVVTDLQVPADSRAWRLLLLRFQSDAAGDDWSGGAWAADLRWELLASHPL